MKFELTESIRPVTYTVNSSDPSKVSVQLHKNNPYLLVSAVGFGDMVFQLFQEGGQ